MWSVNHAVISSVRRVNCYVKRSMSSDALLETFNPKLMEGKTVFVTGGGSGINLGIAKSFARVGANIAICGRTLEKLEGAAVELRELGAKVHIVAADVRDYAAMQNALHQTLHHLGPVHTV